MSSTVYYGAFSLVEGVISITLNACIVLINIKSLRNGSKLTPSDVIHVVIGTVNIALRGLLLGHFLALWLSVSYSTIWFYVTVFPLPFLIYYTFWLTAWLCAYYCTSITTSSHRLCTGMKRCLSTFLPLLLVSTGLGSLLISVPAIWILFVKIQEQNCGNGTVILTGVTIASKSIVYTVVVNLLGCGLPFMVILVSLISSVSSLLRHVWNIKQNNPECMRPKLQSHINAIRTMVLLLMLSGIFYIAENILFNTDYISDTKIIVSWSLIFVSPTAEAIILIQASLKLRTVFLGVVCPAKLVNNIKNLNPNLNSKV